MDKKVFVPFSEDLVEAIGLTLGDLVPFNLDYECVRLLGTSPPPAERLENEGVLDAASG